MEEIGAAGGDPQSPISRFRPKTKKFQTDIDRNSIVRSRLTRNSPRSDVIFPEESYQNDELINREQFRLYGSGRREQQGENLNQIKRDVQLLESQLAQRRQYNSRKKFKLKKHPNRSRLYTYSIPNEEYERGEERDQYIKKLRNKYISPQYYRLKTSPKKKLYRIKHKISRYQEETEDSKLSMPLISMNRVSLKKYRTDDDMPVLSYSRKNIARHPLNLRRLLRTTLNLKRVRKIVNVILFTIRLRTFNARMRKKRIKIFKNFVEESLNSKLLQLKDIIIQYSKPFFITLIDQSNFNYRLQEKDEPKLNKQRVVATLKLINMQIKCLQKCVSYIIDKDLFSETFYLLCKHGNYSCIQQINTNEEMNLICVSEVYGYSRSDKNLEKSSILSLFFIKILLFNILLQPERVNIKINRNINPTIIYSNLRLIGNIFYQLFISVQDQYLEKAPLLYKIGNWIKLKKKFNFKIADSMTIKEGFYQKDELISGLSSHNYIQSIYKLEDLIEERRILTELVKLLHKSIVRYHLQFRKQTFIM